MFWTLMTQTVSSTQNLPTNQQTKTKPPSSKQTNCFYVFVPDHILNFFFSSNLKNKKNEKIHGYFSQLSLSFSLMKWGQEMSISQWQTLSDDHQVLDKCKVYSAIWMHFYAHLKNGLVPDITAEGWAGLKCSALLPFPLLSLPLPTCWHW